MAETPDIDRIIAECIEFDLYHLSAGPQRLAFNRITSLLARLRFDTRGTTLSSNPSLDYEAW